MRAPGAPRIRRPRRVGHIRRAPRAADLPGAKAIVDAAIDVFGRHGYHGTSIRDIAERAGLSSAALYHHFSSKQDLLFQIMDRGIEALVHQTEEAYAAAPPTPQDRLAAIVRVHVLAHTVDPVG